MCGSRPTKTLLRRTFNGVNDSCLERVSKFKLLGVWQQDNLCWNYRFEQAVKKAINRLYYLRECRKANLPTVRDPRHHDILYQNTPTRICVPVVGRFAHHLEVESQSIQKQVPRYYRDTKNIPSNVRGQM